MTESGEILIKVVTPDEGKGQRVTTPTITTGRGGGNGGNGSNGGNNGNTKDS